MEKKAEAQVKNKAMETKESNIHIGHLIREQLRKDQRSASWLAREIHCTRNHVYKIFNKSSLDSNLILKISKAMHFNFFSVLFGGSGGGDEGADGGRVMGTTVWLFPVTITTVITANII